MQISPTSSSQDPLEKHLQFLTQRLIEDWPYLTSDIRQSFIDSDPARICLAGLKIDDPFLGKRPKDMTIFELLGVEESLEALIEAGILEDGQTMEDFLDMPWQIDTDHWTP